MDLAQRSHNKEDTALDRIDKINGIRQGVFGNSSVAPDSPWLRSRLHKGFKLDSANGRLRLSRDISRRSKSGAAGL